MPLLPEGSQASPPWGLLGHAIGLGLAWSIRPGIPPTCELAAHSGLLPDGASHHLLEVLSMMSAPYGELAPELAARVCWIAGLLDNIYRSGRFDLDRHRAIVEAPDAYGALAAAPHAWITDVGQVLAAGQSTAQTFRSAKAVAMAPTFAGSRAVGGADADFIAGGTLVDIKATSASKWNKRMIYQVVSYSLLDWDDQYHIEAVTIWLPRFGVEVVWPLEQLLHEMSGESISLAQLRIDLRKELIR